MTQTELKAKPSEIYNFVQDLLSDKKAPVKFEKTKYGWDHEDCIGVEVTSERLKGEFYFYFDFIEGDTFFDNCGIYYDKKTNKFVQEKIDSDPEDFLKKLDSNSIKYRCTVIHVDSNMEKYNLYILVMDNQKSLIEINGSFVNQYGEIKGVSIDDVQAGLDLSRFLIKKLNESDFGYIDHQ